MGGIFDSHHRHRHWFEDSYTPIFLNPAAAFPLTDGDPNDICALCGDRRHVPPRALLGSYLFGADVDMEIEVDLDGDGDDGGINGYYDYCHTNNNVEIGSGGVSLTMVTPVAGTATGPETRRYPL